MKFKFVRIAIIFIAASFFTNLMPINRATAGDFPESTEERRAKRFGSILDRDKETGKVTIFGKSIGKYKKAAQARGTKSSKRPIQSAKRACLWRAALNSVREMPILVSDSNSGVISTDWYEDSDFPNERYKFNILVGQEGGASLHVTAFKQIHKNGEWRDAKVRPAVGNKMKDKIVSRAKELKAEELKD